MLVRPIKLAASEFGTLGDIMPHSIKMMAQNAGHPGSPIASSAPAMTVAEMDELSNYAGKMHNKTVPPEVQQLMEARRTPGAGAAANVADDVAGTTAEAGKLRGYLNSIMGAAKRHPYLAAATGAGALSLPLIYALSRGGEKEASLPPAVEELCLNIVRKEAPTAMKLASEGRLHEVMAAVYGVKEVNLDTAGEILGSCAKLASRELQEQLENIQDIARVLPAKVAERSAALYCPPGISQDTWNLMRVEKCACLLDMIETAQSGGLPKEAAVLMDAHDELVDRTYTYFQAKSAAPTVANPKLWETIRSIASRVYGSPMVRDAGKKVLGGGLLGAGMAAGAYPIVSGMTANAMDQARDRALQTALGTAGIAVGANQLNNILNQYTVPPHMKRASDESAEISDDKLQGLCEDFAKLAMSFLFESLVDDSHPKAAEFRRNMKVSAVCSFADMTEKVGMLGGPSMAPMGPDEGMAGAMPEAGGSSGVVNPAMGGAGGGSVVNPAMDSAGGGGEKAAFIQRANDLLATVSLG